MRNDVPRGKPYTTTGNPPSVGFNSDPHPSTSVAPGMYQNSPSTNLDGNPAGGAPQPTAIRRLLILNTPFGCAQAASAKYGPAGTNNGLNN